MNARFWRPSTFLLVGALALLFDITFLWWRYQRLAGSLGSEPLNVFILPAEELVLRGYALQLSDDSLLKGEGKPNLDLQVLMERARLSEDAVPQFRFLTKSEPPRKVSKMRYYPKATEALGQQACRTNFSFDRDPKAKEDSTDLRVWSPSPAESDDFRSLALRSSAALVLDVETEREGAGYGPGCRRFVEAGETWFPSFTAPAHLRFDIPADQTVFLTFERLRGEPQPWQGKETPFQPLDISSANPLRVQSLLIRKPSSPPGNEAVAARGEPRSIQIRELALADGQLHVTFAGKAKIHGSRVASPGWAEQRPHSASGWLALMGIIAGHCAILWGALRLPRRGRDADMENVFISYSHADRPWAEWIAWILEEAGHSVVLDIWDFRPGEHFVLEMDRAAAGTGRTIIVLSENYLRSEYTQPEWAAAFAEDPSGERRKLIPIRVEPCQPRGLLRSIIYVDLVGLGEEDARLAVLGAFSERPNRSAPRFPGRPRAATQAAPYPGSASASVLAPALLEGRPETRGPSLTSDERFALMGKLNALPPQQLNMLLFALSPPPGLIPPMPAPQGDRVAALLGWAEGPGGCGLGEVQRLLATVLTP
ncbi:MAG: toll/interleukin-1 receptor domain-containing protein [Thermoanaerobaculia bacterium]